MENRSGPLILYRTADGRAEIALRVVDGTVWLTQFELAELFQTTKQNISLHARNVLAEGELSPDSVVKESLTTAADGKRYATLTYSLEMILAIGYRVRSPRGTQFRQWATTALRDYLVKGFVMNDARLKEPGGLDYFDELLSRIRDIRASEKRFYQKVRDLFALSQDYGDDEAKAQAFFAEVQNKMLFAATGATAAELIVARADATQLNMNLTAWAGERVRKADVIVAKNYLAVDEVTALNRITTMFLDYAEDRVGVQRQQLTMADWRANVDRFLAFNERAVLLGKGRVTHERMKIVVNAQYDVFDAARRKAEALAADTEDMKTLEDLHRAALAKAPRKTRNGA